MKVRVTGKGFTLSEISVEQMEAVMKVHNFVSMYYSGTGSDKGLPEGFSRIELSYWEWAMFHGFNKDYWGFQAKEKQRRINAIRGVGGVVRAKINKLSKEDRS
jgi:hypothetical protein